eukprot:4168082-Lingulodinium_polyedra.AAC.1
MASRPISQRRPAIAGMFAVGSVGSWSFGLFGCWCSLDGRSTLMTCSRIAHEIAMDWPRVVYDVAMSWS